MMKKIEAVIQSVREDDVVNELCKLKLGGFSINQGRGCGGSSNDFTNVKTICTIVKDSNVKEVVDAIVEAANMSTSGDGKVFVSTVDEVTDISTKEQGYKYL
jgi:nitrogen regulatory protein P-II 1